MPEDPKVAHTDSSQTVFKDTMGSSHSSMSWHDQVIEEEKQGGAVTKKGPEFGSNPNSDTVHRV